MISPFKRHFAILTIALAALTTLAVGARAQQVDPSLFAGLQWRNIGPFHGGRISAVSGALGQPGVYYVGTPLGGVWKSTSAGITWYPIFDQITEVASIGAVGVAPSDPNIIYVGSGDAISQGGSTSYGDGMYKSTDAGKTWTRIGLEGTRHIAKLIIDPKNPDIVIVAALASPGGGTQRGIFRTTDGGKTWTNTLHPDDETGGRDLSSPYEMPNVIFATTIQDGGGGGGGGGFGGGAAAGGAPAVQRTKLYKSLDEGQTWTEVPSFPYQTGRVGVAVAQNTKAQRIYIVGSAQQGGSGLYRSDDQGATWKHMAGDDTRISNGQGTYSCGVWVDTNNPDIVYTVSTAAYRSTDGGNTFIAFKGAPGGEDYHDIWIDPTNGQRMLFGVDQGASVTLDGGKTWSGWYNQPIDQIYHLSTDNRYPYWVMGSQQDTGAVMTRAFSDQGQITTVDWLPLPSSEFGTITPDPIDPNIIYGVGYGNGQGSGLIKINLATGQWDNINPAFGADANLYRAPRDQWRRFDTVFDPHAMYVGAQCLLVSRDQGQSFKPFSPDLTTAKGEPMVPCGVPPAPGTAAAAAAGRGRGRGAAAAPAAGAAAPAAGAARGAAPAAAGAAGTTPAPATPAAAAAAVAGGGRGGGGGASINDFAISTVKQGVFWTGSSNGQVYNSMDAGKTWNNVTNFPDACGGVTVIEAGHSDVNTAYVLCSGGGAAAEQHYIYRTHDAGKTWTRIVNGLPTGEITGSTVHVIREDTRQKGLLFAGTETTVYISFDDGDHWQSFRQNLPTTSVRDMVFHTDNHMNDLVIATYGRGFWVLADATPLRELAAKAQEIAAQPAYLFKPGDAIRARANSNWDQPMEPEMPHAVNPPFGAIIYYHLSRPPQGEIKLQVWDAAGKLVRTISSVPPPPIGPHAAAYPDYWIRPVEERALSTKVGTNRTNWDLRYDDPPGGNPDLENQMNVAPGQVQPGPHGPMALPGVYTLKLLVDGATYTQSLTVHNDPRVGESAQIMAALKAQHELMMDAYNGMKDAYNGNLEVAAVRQQVAALSASTLPADVATATTALDAKLATFGGNTGGRGGRGGGGGGGGRGRGGAAADPNAITAFSALNTTFNTIIGLSQNGMDMAPTKALIDTWEADCKNYNRTVTAWKAMQTTDLVAYNALLTKNSLKPLTITPTALADPPCTFPAAGTAAAGH